MLVLSRKNGEKIHIGNDIVVTLLVCKEGKARIGIEAPEDVNIDREELLLKKLNELNEAA